MQRKSELVDLQRCLTLAAVSWCDEESHFSIVNSFGVALSLLSHPQHPIQSTQRSRLRKQVGDSLDHSGPQFVDCDISSGAGTISWIMRCALPRPNILDVGGAASRNNLRTKVAEGAIKCSTMENQAGGVTMKRTERDEPLSCRMLTNYAGHFTRCSDPRVPDEGQQLF